MREAWDRRVRSDYRYWMSDGVDSDEHMWATGKRDFSLLSSRIPADFFPAASGLELGCGVGRLLRAAAETCDRVYGVDVSEEAIGHARGLLADVVNVELRASEKGLADFSDGSLDFVYAFAVLGHLPSRVLSEYLLEINRVMSSGGYAALQLYVGPVQDTVVEDTLVIRSYPKTALEPCLEKSGFALESVDELELPFEARDLENDRTPFIYTLKKVSSPIATAEDLCKLLTPDGEAVVEGSWQGSEFEYRMAITRVQQLIGEKKFLEAEAVLRLAVEQYAAAEEGARALLGELEITVKALGLKK